MRTRVFSAAGMMLSLGLLMGMLQACSAQAADDQFAGIAPAMQTFVDKGDLAGIVTLVATRDKIVHQAAVGTSDGKRKLQTHDLFWIASMSKPITAVAAAMLVEDGKLKYDDPVSKYVPEFKNIKFGDGPPARPILVRDLLNHTSGLPYNYEVTQKQWTLQQYVQQIAKQPLNFQPGAQWDYSNAGIDVVGYIVQVAAGMPFDQFLQKRLFDPVGMKDTTFWVKPEDLPRVAHAFMPDPETHKLQDRPFVGLYGIDLSDKQRPPLGAAGLFSTAEDLAKFYQMMLNKGKVGDKVILKPESVAELTKNQIGTLQAGRGLQWGYGFCVVTDPKGMESDAMLSPGTFGHVGLYGTNSWADPKTGTIYVILLEWDQIDDYLDSPMRTQFQQLATKGLEKP